MSRRADSEQELQDKITHVMDPTTKSMVPVIHARRPPQTVELSQETLRDMELNVERWSKDPTILGTYLQRKTYMHLQIINYLIEHPPAGRSTPQNMIAAASRFSELAERLLERIQVGGLNAGKEESPLGRSSQRRRALQGQQSGGEET